MKKYIYGLFFVLAMCCMSSCGSDSEMVSTNAEHKINYRFVVNVTKENEDGTRTTDKIDWTKGDIIYVATDSAHFFTMTYQGYWKVNTDLSFFSYGKGKLHACYGLSEKTWNKWTVHPEQLLYTDEGTYTSSSDDVIYINLNMNKRPYAKLKVKGIDGGYAIANIQTQQTLTNLWNMTLEDTFYNTAAADYDEQTQTATYYGIVSPTDNKTHILLYNADGIGYSRTYDKVMTGGEAIVLNGPNSSESSSWTKHTLVKSITLNTNSIGAFIDGSYDLVATIDPIDAENGKLEWSTSDADVATVDENGHVNVKNTGEAIITAQTKDGTRSASCVIYSDDHVWLGYSELVYNQGNGQIKVSVRNEYYKPVDVKRIYLKNESTSEKCAEYNVSDGKIERMYDTYKHVLNFSNVPSGDYILEVNYICNNKEYTVGKVLTIK